MANSVEADIHLQISFVAKVAMRTIRRQVVGSGHNSPEVSVSLDGQRHIIVDHRRRTLHSGSRNGLDSLTRKFQLLNELLGPPVVGFVLQAIIAPAYDAVHASRFPLTARSRAQWSSRLHLILGLERLRVHIQVPLMTHGRKVVPMHRANNILSLVTE